MKNEKLTFEEFAVYIRDNIKRCMDETYSDAEPVLKQQPKPGGVTLTGLELVRNGQKTASVFYLDPEYEQYLRGEDIDHIVHKIAQKYMSVNLHIPDLHTKPIFDWSYSKSRVVPALISIDKAKRDSHFCVCPTVKLPNTNMGMTYYLDIEGQGIEKVVAVPVSHDLVKSWGITMQELDDSAKQNAPTRREKDIILANSDIDMYIATNTGHFFGATSILYPGVYDEICDKVGDDIYILPTSVHECSCVPRSKVSLYESKRVLEAINRSHPDDYLSNQVLIMENGQLKKAHK